MALLSIILFLNNILFHGIKGSKKLLQHLLLLGRIVTINTMRIIIILLGLILTTPSIYSQYPFEKYPAPTYKEYDNWKFYDWLETKQTENHTLTINQFFKNKDTFTIQLTTLFPENGETSSVIRIFKNKTEIQKMTDEMLFHSWNTGHEPIRVADINGDGLLDLKIITSFLGNGIAALNVHIIYLFQTKEEKFIKISYVDKMDYNRLERDVDGDGNYEIITMDLTGHERHNYWNFNLFEFDGENLKNANKKEDYPIMIQYLYKKNYTVTDKISRAKMKEFALQLPNGYDKQE